MCGVGGGGLPALSSRIDLACVQSPAPHRHLSLVPSLFRASRVQRGRKSQQEPVDSHRQTTSSLGKSPGVPLQGACSHSPAQLALSPRAAAAANLQSTSMYKEASAADCAHKRPPVVQEEKHGKSMKSGGGACLRGSPHSENGA